MPRLTMTLAGGALALLVAGEAHATCYHATDKQGRLLECCGAPHHPPSCRVVDVEAERRRREENRRQLLEENRRLERDARQRQRRREAERRRQRQRELARRFPTPVRPAPRADGRARWRDVGRGWGWELSLAPFFCLTEFFDAQQRHLDLATGAALGVGWRYRRRYRRGGRGGKWPSITLLPASIWLGHHLGADLRLGAGYQHRGVDGSSSPSLSLDLVPVLRVASPDGRLRLPSVVSLLLPAVGLQHVSDRPPQLRLRMANLSLGYLLSRWLLLEAELSVLLRFPLRALEAGEREIGRAGLDARLRLVVPL